MAIKITTNKTDKNLFCASKWWGDPDMPEDMNYPTMSVNDPEWGEDEYPLTFICQINCEDIAPYDKEGILPKEGMFYFFGNIDGFLGYETPVPMSMGEWPKGNIHVKYAKSINMEAFRSVMLVDDEDGTLTEPAREIIFEECNDLDRGHKLLGQPTNSEIKQEGWINLFQIDSDSELELLIPDNGLVNFMIKESDLKYGNYKKSIAKMQSL